MVFYDPHIHHRRSIRLKGYDYSRAGLYFITLCVQNRIKLFGQIENGQMILNTFGSIAKEEWEATANIRPNCSLGEYIVMPDHFHAIISIDYQIGNNKERTGKFQSPTQTIGAIIRGFKGAATKRIKEYFLKYHTGELRFAPDPQFNQPDPSLAKFLNDRIEQKKSIWQRDYWERIIRDKKSYIRMSEYIRNNPLNWEKNKKQS
jgi:REP element-mobilizing transposase RayT